MKLLTGHSMTWDILHDVYYDMNTFYPHQIKLFIMDDAESLESVLKILNHLCKVMTINQDLNVKKSWKFLVTSQKRAAYSQVYSDIGKENFIDVNGFNLEETKMLFRFSGLDDATIKEIRDMLGPRPLPLKIAMSSLKSNQVIAILGMQKLHNGSVLFIFNKKVSVKRPSFRSYNKTTIVRLKLLP